MKTLESITIAGQKVGTIWMPPIECTQEFKVRFTPAGGAFSRKWEGLDDALTYICVDDTGDFQSTCKITDGYMQIVWVDEHGYSIRAIKDIPICKLTKEYLTEDYPMPIYYISEKA